MMREKLLLFAAILMLAAALKLYLQIDSPSIGKFLDPKACAQTVGRELSREGLLEAFKAIGQDEN